MTKYYDYDLWLDENAKFEENDEWRNYIFEIYEKEKPVETPIDIIKSLRNLEDIIDSTANALEMIEDKKQKIKLLTILNETLKIKSALIDRYTGLLDENEIYK